MLLHIARGDFCVIIPQAHASLQACLQANACIWGITDTESERSGDEVPVMCRRKPAGLSGATSQAHASLQACLQAGWGKIGGIGKMPQPEAIGKQADWGKIGGIGKMPQPEA